MAFEFNPASFDAKKYGLPTLDADVLVKAYDQYREVLDQVIEADDSEVKADGTKRVSKLETFASGKEVPEYVSIQLEQMVRTFWDMALADPEKFVVCLYELRSIMSNQIKGFADAVLPEVLATVSIASTDNEDPETEELRHEAYGLRQAIQKQLEAFTSLEIEVSIPKKKRNTRGGEVEVFDLPNVPKTRTNESDAKAGRPAKTASMVHFVNGSEVPVGTTLAKLALLLSTPDYIVSEFDIERFANKTDQKLNHEFCIEFPNGSILDGIERNK